MPAHVGFADKFRMFGSFVAVNLSQSEGARAARKNRVGTGNAGRLVRGIGDNASRRAPYVAWKKVEAAIEHRSHSQRELACSDYIMFRGLLNQFGPGHDVFDNHGNRLNRYADQNEWDLYLRPGTAFDQNCEQIFAGQEGTGFKVICITHKSDVQKLKRIEGVFPSGRVVIWWSDAS